MDLVRWSVLGFLNDIGVAKFILELGNTSVDSLTLYGTNSFFCRFAGHNLLYALFIYRLIGITLIGNFFDDPFLKIELKFR